MRKIALAGCRREIKVEVGKNFGSYCKLLTLIFKFVSIDFA